MEGKAKNKLEKMQSGCFHEEVTQQVLFGVRELALGTGLWGNSILLAAAKLFMAHYWSGRKKGEKRELVQMI